jgi:hypothetical protein
MKTKELKQGVLYEYFKEILTFEKMRNDNIGTFHQVEINDDGTSTEKKEDVYLTISEIKFHLKEL